MHCQIENKSVNAGTIKNAETTKYVMLALTTGECWQKICDTMKFLDVLYTERGARDNDLLAMYSSMSVLSRRYQDERGTKRVKYFIGYRLGDMAVSKFCGLDKDLPSEIYPTTRRDQYARCCAWLTARGVYIVPKGYMPYDGAYMTTPGADAADGKYYCMAPDANNDVISLDADKVRNVWAGKVNSTFFPITHAAPSDMSIGEEWAVSKIDIFTLQAQYAASLYMKNAARDIDILDSAVYRIYKACRADPGYSFWGNAEWTKRVLSKEDASAVEAACRLEYDIAPEDFAFYLKPSSMLLSQMILKTIDLKKDVQQRATRGSTDNIAAVSKAFEHYLISISDINNSKHNKILMRAMAHVNNAEPDLAGKINQYKQEILALRGQPAFTAKAADRVNFYIKHTMPDSYMNWMLARLDTGALIDGITTCETAEYQMIKALVQRDMAKEAGFEKR